MKVKFISNACCIVESNNGTRVVSDPWLHDGVFEGSWCHFHRLETDFSDIQNVDAVYLSHIHPDHYDERYFEFPKDIPIIVLDYGFNFLTKKLIEKGYTNLLKVKNKESIIFKDFKLTLFSPFITHPFFEENTKIGNLIDSAIVYESDEQKIFNANDNTPSYESCLKLKKLFGRFDLAMINYNNAGPYPSCFNNLSDEEKLSEHNANLKRNVNFLHENLKILNPKFFLPFAGAYVIGGSLSYKNKYLGTMTWDQCINMLENKEEIKGTSYIALREKNTFDLDSKKLDREYIKINQIEVEKYINNFLTKIKYPYQLDDMPDKENLIQDITTSKTKLYERLNRIKIIPDMDVYLIIYDQEIPILEVSKNQVAVESKGKLECSLDPRLLRRILDRSSHWNNAEIGCHIEFNRVPNYYSPDIHTALQFFHL